MDDGFEDFFYASNDGLRLHARIYAAGDATRLPVVCLPGLTRNVRDFHELALFLSRHPRQPRTVISFDCRGRGDSDRDPEPKNYNIAVEAGDVLSGLSALGVARAAFIGTSRGGMIIHILAAMQPDVLKCVVLNDVGPELGVGGLAHIKAYLSNAQVPRTYEEAEQIQRSIHGAAFPALGDDDWKRMVAAIYRDDAGRPASDYDPAIVAGLKDLDLTQPLATLWVQFDALASIPLLVIRGGNSALLTTDILERMSLRHPDCETVEVAGQGHPPMLETGGLPQRIAAFLERAG